ncbi:hypothetical protein [Desulfurobacterium sp.]
MVECVVEFSKCLEEVSASQYDRVISFIESHSFVMFTAHREKSHMEGCKQNLKSLIRNIYKKTNIRAILLYGTGLKSVRENKIIPFSEWTTLFIFNREKFRTKAGTIFAYKLNNYKEFLEVVKEEIMKYGQKYLLYKESPERVNLYNLETNSVEITYSKFKEAIAGFYCKTIDSFNLDNFKIYMKGQEAYNHGVFSMMVCAPYYPKLHI